MENTIKHNYGFSLIELLVIIAITGILTAAAAVSIATVNNANVSKAANRFEALLNNSRATSMAMGTEAGKLILTKENGKLYGQIGENGEKELICNNAIKVYFNPYNTVASYSTRDMTTTEMTNGSKHIIKFQTSGVAKDMTSDTTDTDVNFCKLILKNNNRSIEVILYRQTGKHELLLF